MSEGVHQMHDVVAMVADTEEVLAARSLSLVYIRRVDDTQVTVGYDAIRNRGSQ
jgi:hypothetical protein